MKGIYLDYASTTYTDPKVVKKMILFMTDIFGNPSSLHSFGREAKDAISKARKKVADILGGNPMEIIFTGSGTESINLALFGVAEEYKKYGKHIIISKIEHKAVLECAKELREKGFEITYLNVNPEGFVDPKELERALRSDTTLVSIMYANNEIGTIEPLNKISKIIRKFRSNKLFPLLHTDACQAAGALSLRVNDIGVDLLSLNASKIYGPKGIGCLYVNRRVELKPVIFGGGQERGLRSGTENVAGIVGFAEALELSEKMKVKENLRLLKLRNHFFRKIGEILLDARINGPLTNRLPNNINISVSGVSGERLVLELDKKGICVSTGSACTAKEAGYSHVLKAIGLDKKYLDGSIRITMGRKTTQKDLNYLLNSLRVVCINR